MEMRHQVGNSLSGSEGGEGTASPHPWNGLSKALNFPPHRLPNHLPSDSCPDLFFGPLAINRQKAASAPASALTYVSSFRDVNTELVKVGVGHSLGGYSSRI